MTQGLEDVLKMFKAIMFSTMVSGFSNIPEHVDDLVDEDYRQKVQTFTKFKATLHLTIKGGRIVDIGESYSCSMSTL